MACLSPFSVPWHPQMGHKGITADFGSQGPSATPTLECPLLVPTYLSLMRICFSPDLWVLQRISRRVVNGGGGHEKYLYPFRALMGERSSF